MYKILLTILSFWKEKDKQMHASVSAAIGAVIALVAIFIDGMTPLSGLCTLLLANVPGIIKELIDSKEEGNFFDKRDLIANLSGSTLAIILVKLLSFLF